MEDKLQECISRRDDQKHHYVPFCLVLGDTTVHSCCPDEVAALHLNADVLVHYGHACLTPTGTLPVLYSFGKLDVDIPAAVQHLEEARLMRKKRSTETTAEHYDDNKFLLLYQVGYHHAMQEIQSKWNEMASNNDDTTLEIILGQIPGQSSHKNKRLKQPPNDASTGTNPSSNSCCQIGTLSTGGSSSCGDNPTNDGNESCCKRTSTSSRTSRSHSSPEPTDDETVRPLAIGGLELPKSISTFDDLSEYTVIFFMDNIDDEESNSNDTRHPQQRQYVNSMLCFLSLSNPPRGGYWMYSPATGTLNTDAVPPPALHRRLKRRFFLTQRARDANVFGILVSNLSQQHLVEVVKSLQRLIEKADKASYSFAVGKINPAKLANFAEIEVFCLVACREHSLLDDEREYPVPVVTPMELEMALGGLEWGSQAYSLDCQDVMMRQQRGHQNQRDTCKENGNESASVVVDDDDLKQEDDGDDDDDAPYFSLVTGGYVAKVAAASASGGGTGPADRNLRDFPGQGQVVEYKSEAANFLRRREFQGLQSKVGETAARAASQGLTGIASDYAGS
jgi:diphthamide biosynthesis protein 2